MIRTALCGLILVLGSTPPEKDQVDDLIQRLGDPDWVEQAKAAKELLKIGEPASSKLKLAGLDDSPAVRYWATLIVDTMAKGSKPPPSPQPKPAVKKPAPKGPIEVPDETNQGSIMFICNNTSHGDMEVVLSRCPACAKLKRFFYNYGTNAFHCGVCEAAYSEYRCTRCNQPPRPRARIHLKRH